MSYDGNEPSFENLQRSAEPLLLTKKKSLMKNSKEGQRPPTIRQSLSELD
jgi:hypothetical protein